MPYMHSQAMDIQKIDVVWDCHFQENLKSEKRNFWGVGVWTKVFINGKIKS